MKKIPKVFIRSIISLTGFSLFSQLILLIPEIDSEENTPFAVVELYTSQGCSSCPPADAILRRIASRSKTENLRIFPLSFHVDYWNDLGWEDPYSQSAFSQRQRLYAQKFPQTHIYTPQVIINGKTVVPGHDENLIQKTIHKELKSKGWEHFELTLQPSEYPDQLIVHYKISGPLPGYSLNLAIIERGLSNPVPRGENGGQTLAHENVVRQFQSISLKEEEGSLTVPWPKMTNRKNAAVIGFLQDPDNRTIRAAEVAEL